MSWCGPLWAHLVWDCLCFLDLDVFPFPGWGSFQLLFLQIISLPFPLNSSPSGTPTRLMLVCLILSQIILISLISFFCSVGWFPLLCLADCWSIPLYHLIYCWFHLVYFILFYFYLFYFWLHWVFVAVRGLFSGWGGWGLLFVVVRRLFIAVASLVVEHGL